MAAKGFVVLNWAVEPGFLRDFELAVDSEQYVLLHNQHARLTHGVTAWSFGFDDSAGRVGLVLGPRLVWLAPGETAGVAGTTVRLWEPASPRARAPSLPSMTCACAGSSTPGSASPCSACCRHS
jgi:hypothetical protein